MNLEMHFKVHKSIAPRDQSTPMTTTMSKALRLPRNLYIEVNPSDLLCLPQKVDFGPTKHEVSIAPARKCARRHNESAVSKSTRPRRS